MPPLGRGNMNVGVTTECSVSTKVHLSLDDARNPPSLQDRLAAARAETKSRPPKKNVVAKAPRGNLDPPDTTINTGGFYDDRLYGVKAEPAPMHSTSNQQNLYFQAMQDAMRRQSESAAYYYAAQGGYPYNNAYYGAVPSGPYGPPSLATSRAGPAPAPQGPNPSFARSRAPAPALPVSRTAAKPPGPAYPTFTLPAQPNTSGRRAPDPPGEKPSTAYRQDYRY